MNLEAPVLTQPQEVYQVAIRQWGMDKQLAMVQEECAELIVAISKVLRRGGLGHPGSYSATEALALEYADVKIMMDQLRQMVEMAAGTELLKTAVEIKLKRLADNLGLRWTPRPSRVVTCLCGSTRFSEAFRRVNREETLAGNIVLSIGDDRSSDAALGLDSLVKIELDELHLDKIQMADQVVILNQGGYIGKSTMRELKYAIELGRVIHFLEPDSAPLNGLAIDELPEVWDPNGTGGAVRA